MQPPQNAHLQHQAYVQPTGQQAPMAVQDLEFKFAFMTGNGAAASIRAKRGVVNHEGVLLDGMQLPISCVADTETRSNRVIISLRQPDHLGAQLGALIIEDEHLVLQIRSPIARDVEMAIDRLASHQEAAKRWLQLSGEGRREEYRMVVCPNCQASVDLSCLPASGFFYCRFCTTIHHHHASLPHADAYHPCDRCNMFDRNQAYTELYFYFLLVIWGFSHSRHYLCDNCARRIFWKALAINFVFILGVPAALWVGLKSSIGRRGELAELASYNRLALKGRPEQAAEGYRRLQQVLGDHPGLHVNLAQAHHYAGDEASAVVSLNAALAACPNYVPAIELMRTLAPSGAALPSGDWRAS